MFERSQPGRREPGAAVLLYHRVASPVRDPWALAVSPTHFAEQLAVLRRWGCVEALPDVVRLAREGMPVDGVVAITFDDGYADNLHVAAPLLGRYGLPATVFVAAGYVGSARMFWWDELEDAVFGPDADLEALAAGAGLPHVATSRPNVAEEGARKPTKGWRGWHDQAEGTPESLFVALWAMYRAMQPDRRDAELARLSGAGNARRGTSAERRPLLEAELELLARQAGIEIGAHTVSHPRLSALDPRAQHREIAGARAMLEQRSGRPVVAFSYPFGGADDYTGESVAAARDAGYASAWTTRRELVRAGDPPHELPRIVVPDVDGATFEALLSGLLPRRRRGIARLLPW